MTGPELKTCAAEDCEQRRSTRTPTVTYSGECPERVHLDGGEQHG